MRFLVVGLGSIGERHVRNLLALGYDDIGVVRRERRKPRTVSEESFETFLTLQDGLDSRPDGVIVANPTALHIPAALDAVRSGADVLMEIPLASSLQQVDELVDEVAKSQAAFLMGHNLRFHPALTKMAEIVRSLGQPIFARAEFGEYLPGCHPWEDYRLGYAARENLGGGVILTSIHELDFLYWILGPVADVLAMTTRHGGLEMDVEDTAAIVVRHANSAISEVHLDFVQPTYSRSCKIVCHHGAVQWLFKENKVMVSTHSRPDWNPVFELKDFDFNQTYIDELRHFVRCIRREEEPQNNLLNGIDVLRIGLSALESAKERVVQSI